MSIQESVYDRAHLILFIEDEFYLKITLLIVIVW